LILHIKKLSMTSPCFLDKCEAFPDAPLHVDEMVPIGGSTGTTTCMTIGTTRTRDRLHREAVNALLSISTRPFPERVEALINLECSCQPLTRQKADAAFAECENISMPVASETSPFISDVNVSAGLTDDEALSALDESPGNRAWIENCLKRFSSAYKFSLGGNIIHDAGNLIDFLHSDISLWEADSFPLDCMAFLPNRYGWTFRSTAWSLREQLRREAMVIKKSWYTLFQMAEEQPLLLVLNERAPSDYFTSFIPEGASLPGELYAGSELPMGLGTDFNHECPVLIHGGVKISSSEHRVSLNDTQEGEDLKKMMGFAEKTGRRAVLCDFSRRRFPRSFLRAARFALDNGWGILPMGKLFDPGVDCLPEPKSSRGFPFGRFEKNRAPVRAFEENRVSMKIFEENRVPDLMKHPVGATDRSPLHSFSHSFPHSSQLTLFDPWPISDPEIVPQLSQEEKRLFCTAPSTKPWQDDRIGAREEMELNDDGVYGVAAKPWVVPVMGNGWMRVDDLFKSRLRRFLDE